MALLWLGRGGRWRLEREHVDERGARLALWVALLGYPVVFLLTVASLPLTGEEPALRVLVFGVFHVLLGGCAWAVLRSGGRGAVARESHGVAVADASATRPPVAAPPAQVLAGLAAAAGAIGFAGWLGSALVEVYGLFGVDPPGQAIAGALAEAQDWRLAVYAVVAVVLAPLAEELLFRGVLLSRLLVSLGRHRALLIQAAIFGLWHFALSVDLWPLALPLAAVGWWCGAVRLRTGSIVPSIGAHALFNLVGVLQLRGIG